jgi:hypothetical protein
VNYHKAMSAPEIIDYEEDIDFTLAFAADFLHG